MALKPVPTAGETPVEIARRAQEAAAHHANNVAKEILKDYRAVVERAAAAFELTAIDPATRELLRTLANQGKLNLMGRV